MRATTAAYKALDGLNELRRKRGDADLAFGVALHLGEVAYGNVGGASRLDFTAIGPAVNLASRIEGMTGKLGKRVLLSTALTKELTVPRADPLQSAPIARKCGARSSARWCSPAPVLPWGLRFKAR